MLARNSVPSVCAKYALIMKKSSKIGVTLFICRALAKYCAPSDPIRLLPTNSVLSAYVKSTRMTETGEEDLVLPCSIVEH